MAQKTLGIIMNGVTGRMGMNQHLIRSIVAIRAEGGVALVRRRPRHARSDPGRPQRREARGARQGARHRALDHRPRRGARRSRTTPSSSMRRRRRCARACSPRRSPPASTSIARSRSPPTSTRRSKICRLAEAAGVKHGVVQDKLFLPGLRKLKHAARLRLLRPHAARSRRVRLLGVRGRLQPAQRPSWNYRAEDGGGMILDMLCHWRYVLDNLFGEVQVGLLPRRHPHPRARRRGGQALQGHRRRRRLRHLPARRRRHRADQHARGRRACAATTSSPSTSTARTARRSPACRTVVMQPRMATPRPVWNPDVKQTDRLLRQLAAGARQRRPTTTASSCSGRSSSATSPRTRPTSWTLLEGAKGVQLVECGAAKLEGAPLGRRAAAAVWRDAPAWRRNSRRTQASGRAADPTSRIRCGFPPETRMTEEQDMNAPTLVTALTLRLPTAAASSRRFDLSSPKAFPERASGAVQPHRLRRRARGGRPARRDRSLARRCALDWERTIAYREHLWDLGLGVAEAMDTAQRGMGLDWPTSLELIRRSVAQGLRSARDGAALIASGAGTDHLDPGDARSLDDVIRAYEEQMAAIEALGGRMILMASRALARVAKTPGRLRARLRPHAAARRSEPVIIHWLGEMFDPALAGYWGSGRSQPRRWTPPSRVINANAAQGRRHQDLAARQGQGDRHAPPARQGRAHVYRRRLQLRRADRRRRRRATRDALLGIFDAIAPAASRRARGARRRRPCDASTRSSRRRCRCRATSSGADALLQDRRRVHGLAQRPPGPFHDGRRPAERALDCCTSPSCSASPTAPACSRPSCRERMRCVTARMRHAAALHRRRRAPRGRDRLGCATSC